MARQAPINIIMHYPTSDEGQAELAVRVAQVHADAVIGSIKRLKCPDQQKLQLLDAVIDDARTRAAASSSSTPQKQRER